MMDLSNRNNIYNVTRSGELRTMELELRCMQGEVVKWRRWTAIKIYDFININNLAQVKYRIP